jgi:hypothetical protein
VGSAARKFFEPREADIQSAVLQHWRTFQTVGSLVAAVPNARAFGQAGLTKGLFDLVVLSPALDGATAWLELKRAHGGRLTEAHRLWAGRGRRSRLGGAIEHDRGEARQGLEFSVDSLTSRFVAKLRFC